MLGICFLASNKKAPTIVAEINPELDLLELVSLSHIYIPSVSPSVFVRPSPAKVYTPPSFITVCY